MEQYNAAIEFNARLLNATIDFWTALAYPSLFLARSL